MMIVADLGRVQLQLRPLRRSGCRCVFTAVPLLKRDSEL